MKRNITISITSHIIISLLFYPLMFVTFKIAELCYDYILKINSDDAFIFIASGFLFIVIGMLYYTVGRFFLKPIEPKQKRFLSVWILGSILLFLSIISSVFYLMRTPGDDSAVFFDYMNPLGNTLKIFTSRVFRAFILNDFTYNIIRSFSFSVSALLTSASLWLGLSCKMRKLKKRKKD